ncbi:platelet endothelial cell adhesion molecule isoform X1 [Triplophysa dalaica]|uniref:platelet endothelial cell adhesion molecule isoform X1 n=1 Tax=Triplophysa dalaica TaxID=1582913 RepID=UPI0024DFC6F7|nr:platelet endothelial cell adhesion molecule isoform X1 [Triplophysa dalaica]
MSLCYLCLTLLLATLAARWQAVNTQAAFTFDQVTLTLLPGKEVTSGTNVTLRCEAKVSQSLPTPLTYRFSFLQDDQVVYSQNISYAVVEKTLSPVRVSNSGHYHCTVRIDNKFKKSDSHTLKVTGLQTPMLKVKSDIISEGEDVSATCSALEENGSLSFYFYESNKEIKRVPSSSNSVTTMLSIRNLKETYLQCAYTVLQHSDAGWSNKSNTWKIIVKDLDEITPRINVTPIRNVVEGDRVKIQCEVKALSDLDVFLTKGNTVLHKSYTSFTHSLTVRAEDAGDYVCKAEKGSVQKMATSQLNVTELFSKPMLRLNGHQVFEGDRFHLNCISDVNVTLKINKADIRFILLKEGRQISNSASYSEIASSATNGNYSCKATAKGIEKTSLPLVFKAKVPVSSPVINTVGNVIVGRPFTVSCKAENGTLPITYTLLKDRSPVAERTVMEAAGMAVFDKITLSYPLEIKKFTCRALNQEASPSKTSSPLTAAVIEPVSSPVIMPISLTVTEGSDLYLLCKVQQGTQPITFSWYHNSILIPSSTQEVTLLHGTHIVKAIEREQRGRYYCEATNHASETKKSPPVTITVSLAVWKKALIGVLCILLLVAIIVVLIVLLRKMSNPRRKKQATELSVKPRPKSGDPMRMSLTLDIEDNTALNGTPCVMGRNVWSENVSCSESDGQGEEESELLHPKEVDPNIEVPVTNDIEPEHNTQSTDVQVSVAGVLEQPEAQAALEYAQLNNSEQEPA